MKRKRVTFSEESIQTTLNSVKKKAELKDSEKLRKKLKSLLESNQRSLLCIGSNSEQTPVVASIPEEAKERNFLKKQIIKTITVNTAVPGVSKSCPRAIENKITSYNESSNDLVKRKSKEKARTTKLVGELPKNNIKKNPSKISNQKSASQIKLSNTPLKSAKKDSIKSVSIPKTKKSERCIRIIKSITRIKKGKLIKISSKPRKKIASEEKLQNKTTKNSTSSLKTHKSSQDIQPSEEQSFSNVLKPISLMNIKAEIKAISRKPVKRNISKSDNDFVGNVVKKPSKVVLKRKISKTKNTETTGVKNTPSQKYSTETECENIKEKSEYKLPDSDTKPDQSKRSEINIPETKDFSAQTERLTKAQRSSKKYFYKPNLEDESLKESGKSKEKLRCKESRLNINKTLYYDQLKANDDSDSQLGSDISKSRNNPSSWKVLKVRKVESQNYKNKLDSEDERLRNIEKFNDKKTRGNLQTEPLGKSLQKLERNSSCIRKCISERLTTKESKLLSRRKTCDSESESENSRYTDKQGFRVGSPKSKGLNIKRRSKTNLNNEIDEQWKLYCSKSERCLDERVPTKVSKLPSKKIIYDSEYENESISEIEKSKEKLWHQTPKSNTSSISLHCAQSKSVIDTANRVEMNELKENKHRDVYRLSSDSGESIKLKARKRLVHRDASKLNSSVDKETKVKFSSSAKWDFNSDIDGNIYENIPKKPTGLHYTTEENYPKNSLNVKDVEDQDLFGINANGEDNINSFNSKSDACHNRKTREPIVNDSTSESYSYQYDSDDFDYYSSLDTEETDTVSYYTYSSDNIGDNDVYFDSDSDRTYELPENVAEDVYIPIGTAIKHNLPVNSEISFDSDKSCAQIIEIDSKVAQTAKAPGENKSIEKDLSNGERGEESDTSCPILIQIVNNSPKSSENQSETCSESIVLNDFSDYSLNESDALAEQPQMKAEIFRASNSIQQNIPACLTQVANVTICSYNTDTAIEQITSFKEDTSDYKVITVDNELTNELSKGLENTQLQPVSKVLRMADPSMSNSTILSQSKSAIDIKSLETETPNKIREIHFENHVSDSVDSVISNSDIISRMSKEDLTNNVAIQLPRIQNNTLFFNAVNSNHVIALLKESLYIYGTVKVKLIAGFVNIFGYHPKINETLEVFSPQGYCSLRIDPGSCSEACPSLMTENVLLLAKDFFQADLEKIIEQYDIDKDAIILFERNDNSKKVNMLKKYMTENLFPNMNSIQTDRPFYTSEIILQCILTTKAEKPLLLEPKWSNVAVKRNKVMVIGGKSVGKSTLVRYLVNRNLNVFRRVLLIDLDVGQPEMFVPQTVSATILNTPLLGPGYYLNKEPDKAFLAGQVNVVLLPQQYIRSVEALINYCNEVDEYKNIPWVINTMGYNKGFGDELITFISNLLNPTNIIQITSDKGINNFDMILNKENVKSLELNIIGNMLSDSKMIHSQHDLTLLTSVIPSDNKYQRESDLNPRDVRLAMIICRLSQILTSHAEWLTDVKPICASLHDLKIRSMGDEQQLCNEDLIKTLVGNLVYLCQEQFGQILECKGIGIVRAIDYSLNQIYLLPAVSMEKMENVNCLSVCGIPLPSSILINQGPKVKGIAPYVFSTINKAASMYVKQIYNRPQHFLSGRHKPIIE